MRRLSEQFDIFQKSLEYYLCMFSEYSETTSNIYK